MHSFTVLLSLGSLYCKFKPQGINLPLTQSWRRHLHVAFFLSFTLSLSLSLSLYFIFLSYLDKLTLFRISILMFRYFV